MCHSSTIQAQACQHKLAESCWQLYALDKEEEEEEEAPVTGVLQHTSGSWR